MLQQNPISMMCAECRVSKTHVAYQKHTLRIKKYQKQSRIKKMYQTNARIKKRIKKRIRKYQNVSKRIKTYQKQFYPTHCVCKHQQITAYTYQKVSKRDKRIKKMYIGKNQCF